MRQSSFPKYLLCVFYITCFCVSYAAAAPDLIITDLWPIHYQIQNIGDTDCPWPHATTLLIDGQYRTKDVIYETLKPGQRLNRSFTKEDWSCTGIKQTIQAVADGDGNVNENSESNNDREETWVCDQSPPQITEGPAVVEIQQGDYKVTWKTNKDADSVVLYSKTTGKFTTVSDATQDQD
ncbi:MAG: hypothetical protein KAS17_11120, partial [Victivallaceae bacterium]|nr:hypothetical protein [Victivallaceae bacterium]